MDDEKIEKSIDDIIQYGDESEDDFDIEPEEPKEQTDNAEASEEEAEEPAAEPDEQTEEGEGAEEPAEESEPEEKTSEEGGEYEFYDDGDEYIDYEYDELDEDFEDDEEEYRISTKALTIIAVIMAVIVLFGALSFVNIGFVGEYKKNFARNISVLADKMGISLGGGELQAEPEAAQPKEAGAVTVTENGEAATAEGYDTEIASSQIIPVENAVSAQFAKYKNGVVCASPNKMMFIDGTGTAAWECDTVVVNPVLKTGGDYILLTEKNGTRMCLYNGNENIYDINADDKLINCCVSSNGDVAAVTDKAGYKGAVTVFNKSGAQIFSWASGSDNVICADISAKSRRVAAALLNTDGQAKSSIKIFDIKETEALMTTTFEDSIIFDVRFAGDTLNAFGDNSMIGMTSSGRLLYDMRFTGSDFVHYSTDGDGNYVLLLENANIPVINLYNKKGKLKEQFSTDALPDVIDIYGNNIVYNSGRTIVSGRADGKNMTRFNADMDVRKLFLTDEKTFIIVYSGSVETVTMK